MAKVKQTKIDKNNAKVIELSLPRARKEKKRVYEFLALTDAHLKNKAWSEAIALLKQITEKVPGHEAAWIQLFQACDKSSQFELLLEFSESALKSKPRFVSALVAKAAAKRGLNDTEAALTFLEKAVKLKPADINALNLLGIVQKELGQTKQALSSFNRCISLRPNYSIAYWNRSDLLCEVADTEIEAMLALSKQNGMTDNQRARLHYALARAYEYRKDYELQFEQIELGAKFKRASFEYTVDIEIEEMTQIRNTFKAKLLDIASVPAAGSQPIFICGLPRSGSTLAEHILSTHPEVIAGGEINALAQASAQFLRHAKLNRPFPEWVELLNQGDWGVVANGYLSLTRNLQSNRYFTDKNLQNYRAIGVIRSAFPNAKIIFCRRDPMDNLWGCYKQYFGDGQLFTYSQKELGLMWQAVNETMNFWKKMLGDDLFFLDYEELVQNQEAVTRKLLDYLGLAWNERCLRFYKSTRAVQTLSSVQVRNPISSSRIGQWRHYKEGLTELADLVQLK